MNFTRRAEDVSSPRTHGQSDIREADGIQNHELRFMADCYTIALWPFAGRLSSNLMKSFAGLIENWLRRSLSWGNSN